MGNNYLGVKIDRATHERAMQRKINTLLPQVEASLKALNEGWNDAQKMYDATNYMSQYVAVLKQYGVEQTKLKEIEDILDSLNTQQGIFAQFTNADEYNKAKNRAQFAQNATGKNFDTLYTEYINSADENNSFAHTFAYIMTQDFEDAEDKVKAADFLEKNKDRFASAYGKEYASHEQRNIYDDINSKIQQLKRTGNEAIFEKKAQELEQVKNNDDFKKQNLSGIVKSLTQLYDFDYQKIWLPFARSTIEVSEFLIKNIAPIVLGSSYTTFFDNANDEEIKVLGYYLAKGENSKAKEYITAVENRINKRIAQEEFEKTKGQNLVNVLQGVPIGMRSFFTNVGKNFDSSEYVLPTKDEYLSEKIYADLEDYGGQSELFGKSWGQVAFGGTSALGNMVPAVALSFIPYVGPFASSAAMGLSASGSAYREMKNLGYSEAESRTYSVFVGASEAALNAVLGGIGSAAGSLTDDVMKALGKTVDKAGFKIAVNLGSRFAGEGLEEFLQAWLEPTFKGFITGDWDYDEAWAESLESALVGGVLGLGFGSISAVQQGLNDAKLAKLGTGFRETGNVAALIQMAKESPNKNIRDIVKNVNDGDISNTELGRIIYEYEKKAVTELNGNTASEITKNYINLMRDADNDFDKSVLGSVYSAKKAILDGFDPETLKENSRNPEVRQAISKLGQALNRKIRIEENLVNEAGKKIDGYFDENTGEIVLNADAQNPVQVVLKHELTHTIEGNKNYAKFSDSVLNNAEFKAWLRNNGYADLADAQNKTIAFRKKKGDTNFKKKGATQEELNALANQELLADFIAEKFFNDADGLERLLKSLEPKTMRDFVQTILDVIRKLINKIKGVDNSFEEDLRSLEKKFSKMLSETAKNEKNTDGGVKLKIGDSKKITLGMTDAERTDILKNKTLTVPIYEGQADTQIQQNQEDLSSNELKLVKNAIVKIGEEFNVLKKYNVSDVSTEIYLSKGNLRESVTKKANASQIAKLMPILNEALQNAVGIETHVNRYFYDNNTTAFSNLISGYIENDYFVPIRFGLKQLTSGQTVLYVVVDQTKIKKVEVLKLGVPINTSGAQSSRSTSKLSISKIFSFVKNKDLLRYMPDDMLNNEQKQAKQEAIAETIEYTNNKNDNKYKQFIIKGDNASINRMVQNAAKTNGYTGIYYHGSPEQFTIFDKKKARSSGTFGNGFYFSKSESHAGQYGNLYKVFLKLGNTMKEGVQNLTKSDIRKLLSAVAENEDYSIENYGTYNIDEILNKFSNTDAFSVLVDINATAIGNFAEALNLFNETLGTKYQSVETPLETVVFNPEQIKSADPITYDDNGNVIPLSERFNEEETDIRYSIPNTSSRAELADALSTLTQDEYEKRIIEDYKNAVADIDKAQARLDQVNADIKQILFTPGERDTQALENLNKEKAELEKQIGKYDKKLLQMEALAPLQKLQNRAVRNQKRADTEKFKEKNIGKKSTVLRNEIKDRAQKLTNILKNETKAKHIPTAMQKPVAEFLEIFDMNTAEIDKRIARYDELIANETDAGIKEELQKTRDRLELQGLRLQDKLEKMESVYRDIKNSTDEAVKQGYDETIEGLITTAKNSLSSTNLKDLTYEQLNTVNNMFKALEKHIRDANKLKESAIKESVEQAGQTVIKEVSQNTSEKGNKTTPLKQFVEKYGITFLKPVHAFQLFGSDMLNRLFLEVRKGEDVVAVDAKEAKQTFRKNAKENGYWKWDKETRETFKDKNGKEFTLNLEEKLALYAYSKREQADLHLEIGGIVFGDEIVVKERNKFKVEQKVIINDRNTYKIDKQIMADIINTLTAEQKHFADKMQEYLSVDMAKKGNEISDALYGINLFGEKAYFPLKSSSDFRAFNAEKTADPNIANKSFTNPTIPGANNPVVLQGFMDVWAKHCVDMAMYHGLTLPMENFTKVYNYSEFDGEYASVKNTLAKGYGEQVTKYIESLLTDINGGIRQDPNASVVNKLISLFKKSAVFASLSVIIQQPSSIARAFAYIDPKYVKPTQNPLKEYEECKQYCPVAIIKDMGYFDTSVGKSTQDWITEREITDYENNLERLKDGLKIGDNLLASLPATADAFTWGLIWAATKQETAKRNGLDINSEEVKKQSAERFNEIIINTQVYDSVLSRPAIMRSKDVGMKTATAFLAEPLTSVGMATLGVDAARKGDTKKARRLIAAVATQSILNSVLVSFVYAMRDDDEKMSFGEKYLKSLTVELIEGFNPATYIPIVKDVYSLCQGYDVKRADMNLVADLVNATNRLWSENATPYQKIKGMVGSIASLLGIPVKNLWRDIESFYNTGATIKRNTSIGANNAIRKGLSEALPFGDRLVPEKNEATMLYEAVISGNKKQIKTFRGDKNETQYSSMLRKGLKSEDSRIYEAANARIAGDFETYENIVAEIESEGHFESDIIIGAIESTMDISVSGNTMYDTSDINRMLEEGNTSSAEYVLNKLVELKTIQYVEKGENEKNAQRKAESSVKSGITTYWKERYIEAYNEKNETEKKQIRALLTSLKIYGDAATVRKTVLGWI